MTARQFYRHACSVIGKRVDAYGTKSEIARILGATTPGQRVNYRTAFGTGRWPAGDEVTSRAVDEWRKRWALAAEAGEVPPMKTHSEDLKKHEISAE